MNVDAYVKSVLTVIAMALVVIAIDICWDRLTLSPAQAQTANTNVVTQSANARSQNETFEQLAKRLSAVEKSQKEQDQRIETLRLALQSTVMNATQRGYFPDTNWSTVKWDPDIPPAGGNGR